MHGRNAEYAGIPNRAPDPARSFQQNKLLEACDIGDLKTSLSVSASPLSFNGVDDFLKLSKHGLPEKRAPQIVDLPVDDVGAHLRIASRFEQMIGEKFLAERRCNLGQENRGTRNPETAANFAQNQLCME